MFIHVTNLSYWGGEAHSGQPVDWLSSKTLNLHAPLLLGHGLQYRYLHDEKFKKQVCESIGKLCRSMGQVTLT